MKVICSFCISFLVLLVLMSFLPVNGEEEIYSNMVRLHVIANSDSEEDQALKLKVRDAVLKQAEDISADNMEEACNAIENSKEMLTKAAEKVIMEEGYSYGVEIELGEEKYPERNYEDFTLPAGKYTSLRVKIGEAQGKNWWCVLFPPLCTKSAEEREEAFVATGFTGEQYEAITKPEKKSYKIKFKLLEIIMDIFN